MHVYKPNIPGVTAEMRSPVPIPQAKKREFYRAALEAKKRGMRGQGSVTFAVREQTGANNQAAQQRMREKAAERERKRQERIEARALAQLEKQRELDEKRIEEEKLEQERLRKKRKEDIRELVNLTRGF
jgi:hypothetical protein